MVVSSPWPVCTTVSSGRPNSAALIDASSWGRSEYERPVAPGPPWKSVSPVKTQPRSSTTKQQAPGAWPGVWTVRIAGAGDLELPAVGQVEVPEVVGVGELPQRLVVGVQEDRRDDGLAQRGRDAAVVVVGVGEQDRLHRAARDDGEDVLDRVRGVDDHALVVVADDPDVVVDVEGLAVEAEGAAGDGVVDAQVAGHQSTITTERRTSPWCIFSNAASMSPMPISSVTNASRSSRPCW